MKKELEYGELRKMDYIFLVLLFIVWIVDGIYNRRLSILNTFMVVCLYVFMKMYSRTDYLKNEIDKVNKK